MLPRLLALGLLIPLAALAWVAVVRRRALRYAGRAEQVRRYLGSVALAHLAWASELTIVAVAAQRVAPTWAIAFFYAFAHGLLLVDAALFLNSGMRLQVSLLAFAKALTEFADKRPWRRQLALCVGAATAFGMGAMAFLAHTPAVPWRWAVAALGMAALSSAVSSRMRRALPMAFTYEWDNRFMAAQRAFVIKASHRHSTAQQDLFAPVHEENTYVDARYPLFRTTNAFTGAETFPLTVGAGDKPHVVFIFLESFRAADTGALGAPHKQSITPCFDALAKQGVLWSNFYANGTITSRAMTAALYGILPDFREYSMQAASDPPALMGLPHLFAERGYLCAYFCDGPMDWENKRDFFLRQGFPLFYGAPSIRAAYPQAPRSEWNFSDEYLMRFHADWLAEQDRAGQPTFSSLLTVTNHVPWEAPKDAPHPQTDVDPKSEYGRFLRTMMYSDKALGLYMELLRERGLHKKTVFVIMGDHGQQVEEDRVGWSGRYDDGAVRVPLLLLAPDRLQPQVIHETASQIDVLPTVMDVFNMRGPHHGMGSSLKRHHPNRHAMTIHPWAPGMLSNRVGPFRFVFSFDAHTAALYDLSRDPQERHDVSAHHPALVQEQTQLAWAVRNQVNRLHSEQAMAPPASQIHPVASVRTLGAPAHFPKSYEDCLTRAAALARGRAANTLSRQESHELGAYMIAVRAVGLDDGQRLRLAQFLMARIHLRTMGELTRAEFQAMAQLDGSIVQVLAQKDAPPWLHPLALTVRRLAGLVVTERVRHRA